MSEPPAPAPALASEPAAPTEPVAPADLAPAPSRRERFAWYAGCVVLACLLTFTGMRLWNQDLHAPFYYDLDSLLYLPLVKTTIDSGTHWRNDRVGEPGVQELYDFPVIDHLHFALIWFLGRFTSDVLLVYNVYNLLTYPLTALTAMLVLRWLKLSLPAAMVGALLYAFLPYHQERYQYHYFLAAYWVVPLSLMPALAICKGEFPLYPLAPDGTRRRKLLSFGAVWPLALGVVTASAGAYYAFFACASYAFAGAYGSVMFRTRRAAVAAAWVIAPVVAVGVAYHYPTYAYQKKNGVNPITDRMPEEAEVFGLKLAHLILPANDHNVTALARFRAMYSTVHRPVDAESAGSLGVIGATALIALLVLAVLPHRRRWPEGPLAGLVLFLILLATVGGFGSLFNVLVTAQIRAYNRISVFIGFLCIFAAMWWADRFLLTRTGRRTRRLRYPAFALVLAVGYSDQTPWGWNWFNPNGMVKVENQAERFRADKRFFKEVEEKTPGARVFCLPYVAFPESPPVHQLAAYEHGRGFYMTDTLTWSFGAVKRREADMWQRQVAFEKPDEFLRRIVVRGFDGLFIDGRGYPPRWTEPTKSEPVSAINPREAIHALYATRVKQNAARLPEVVHEDGRQFYLDLRPYRDAYRQLVGAEEFEKQARAEREWIAPLWLKGFTVFDTIHDGDQTNWGTYDATLVLVNPADRARVIDFSFVLGIEVAGEFHFSITGLGGLPGGEFDMEKNFDDAGRSRHEKTREFLNITLPPGRSTVRFRCTPPPSFVPADHRNLCYFIKDFRLVEK